MLSISSPDRLQLRRRAVRSLALRGCVALLASLAACGGPGGQEGRPVFRLNLPNGIQTLDPAFARDEPTIRMVSQLYEGLVRLDTAMNVVPALAKRWDISPDGRRYRFVLRSGVRWHRHPAFGPDSTRLLRASDAVFSLRRMLRSASPGAGLFEQHIDSLAAPSDSTLVIRLKAPFPPFLALLTMPYAALVPPEVVKAEGEDFGRRPCGTGPFVLKRWEPGRALILHKNPAYWQPGLPRLAAVKASFVGSKLSAYAEFRRGRLDMLESPDPAVAGDLLTPTGKLKPRHAGRFRLQRGPQLTTEFLGFLVSDSIRPDHPLRDARLRRAIGHAIDRQALCRYLLRGLATPARAGIIPNGLPSYDPQAVAGFRDDPARARELLAEAGYPNGRGLPPLTYASTPRYRPITTFLQQQLGRVGIRVDVAEYEGATLRAMAEQGELDFWRASWIADYADGENFLSLFYGPNRAPDGYNRFRYDRPAYNALYERARRTTAPAQRRDLYQHMERMLLRDAPAVPLFYYRTLRLLQPKVRGLPMTANALQLDLRRVHFAKPSAAGGNDALE